MNQIDTPQTRCQAGVARGDITPPVGIYHRMWGAATHDRATGVHRPLLATALWLAPLTRDAAQAQLVVALDQCVIDSAEMERIRRAVANAASLHAEQVHVTLSHTHGSGWMSRSRSEFPGGELIGPYLDDVAATLGQLARAAMKAMQPATIVYGQGRCNLAGQRDYFDQDNRLYVCGFNPGGAADDTVMVGRISDEKAACLGTIVNYACHPTSLAWENTLISPDYVGAMRETIEQATGAPCLFLQGASGDLGPREGFVGDTAVADRNGRQLGYAALSALEALPAAGTRFVYAGPVVSGATLGTWKHQPLDFGTLKRQEHWAVRQKTVDLAYRHDLPTLEETKSAHAHWHQEEAKARAADNEPKARDCRAMVERMTRQITRLSALPQGKVFPFGINVLRLGDALWVFVPGELYQLFQLTLRHRFPMLPIIVTTLTGDWQPGYLPAAWAYGYGIYQETIACVGAGALEVVIEAAAREIQAVV